MRTSYVGLLLFGALARTLASAVEIPAPVGFARPSSEERTLFEAILARVESARERWPADVSDALASLRAGLSIPLACAGARTGVRVETSFVAWVNARAGEGASIGSGWACTDAIDATDATGGVVACSAWIMIDPGLRIGDGDGSPAMDRAGNEALLYGELLRLQKQIDRMRTAAWQAAVCEGRIEVDPRPQSRAVRPDPAASQRERSLSRAVHAYLEASLGTEVELIERLVIIADESGRFDLDLCESESAPLHFRAREAAGGENLDTANIGFVLDGERIHVRGSLLDRRSPGRLFVRIEMTGRCVFGGLDQAMVIAPFGHRAPRGFGQPLAIAVSLLALVIAVALAVAKRR